MDRVVRMRAVPFESIPTRHVCSQNIFRSTGQSLPPSMACVKWATENATIAVQAKNSFALRALLH